MAARGMVHVIGEKEDAIQFEAVKTEPSAEAELLSIQLQAILAETTSYRAFFRRVAPEMLA